MADEPERTGYAMAWPVARNNLRAELRPLLEAREQALRARVAELEALLASLYAPIQTTFGATLEGRTE